MNNLPAIFIVIMLLEFLFSIYLLSFRKQVHSIMNKVGVDISKEVNGFNDYKLICFELKKSNKLSKHDRRILWQYILITLSAIILWVVFMVNAFFTDW